MAIVIETCPRCGHDLMDEMIATIPPIPKKLCLSCGWSWIGEREEVIRMPFGGNSFNTKNTYALSGSIYDECIVPIYGDTSCTANNIEGCVFMVSKEDLHNMPKISHDQIAESVARIKKYEKRY